MLHLRATGSYSHGYRVVYTVPFSFQNLTSGLAPYFPLRISQVLTTIMISRLVLNLKVLNPALHSTVKPLSELVDFKDTHISFNHMIVIGNLGEELEEREKEGEGVDDTFEMDIIHSDDTDTEHFDPCQASSML
ncbi:hypothetical protein M422DRAFT_45459 [Sphaerobolus stellatus SS14]|nr:hypothetical protein M422DRAFT_45459 [Sphaerobolus stellatus SS14]